MLPAASGVEINGEIGSRECRHPVEKGGHRRPLGPSTTRLLVVAAATSIRVCLVLQFRIFEMSFFLFKVLNIN